MPRSKRVTPETSLKRAVRDALKAYGWFVFHIHGGLGSYKGISDLIALRAGKTVFIELKAPKGRQSEHQERFQADVERQGGEYLLVKDIDVFLDWLNRQEDIDQGKG